MSFLKRDDICWIPWVCGNIHPCYFGCCCYEPTQSKETYGNHFAKWSSQDFENWWNGKGMHDLRRNMLQKGATNTCPSWCTFNSIPKRTSVASKTFENLKKIKNSKSLQETIEDFDKGKINLRSKPLKTSLSLGMTYNSKCTFCIQRWKLDNKNNYDRNTGRSEANTDEILQILQTLHPDLITCHITGGDLFAFRPYILETILQRLLLYDIKGEATTNAIGLTPEIYEKYIHNTFSIITFSTTTTNKEEYAYFHGVDSWDRVKNNLEKISNKFENHCIKKCAICIMKHNYNKMQDIIKFCADNNITTISLLPVEPTSLIRRKMGEESMSHPNNIQRFMDEWDDLSAGYEELVKQNGMAIGGHNAAKDLINKYADVFIKEKNNV